MVIIRRPEPHEHIEYDKISAVCFESEFKGKTDPIEFYNELVAESETSLTKSGVYYNDKYIAEYNGQIVGGLCAMPYEFEFDGNTVRMCGVGGVCTLPPYRRLGSIRAIHLQMLRDEYEKGTEFSYLYPFSQAYYEKFGYVQSEPRVQWTFSLKYIAANKADKEPDGSFSLYWNDDDDPSGFYEAYARMTGLNTMVKRERCDFRKLFHADPYKRGIKYAYLYRDANGAARGYYIFSKTKENVMDVSEMIYDSPETLRAILKFAASFSADYSLIRFYAPACHNLESMTTDLCAGECARKIDVNGMLRVVHTENALRLARYKGSGEAVIRVVDAFLSRDETIAVRWKDGRFADLSPANRAPDAVMDIGSFSAAIIGRYNINDFKYVKNVEILSPEPLSGIFFKKDIYIANFF
jgi:predicted acetyltransferase